MADEHDLVIRAATMFDGSGAPGVVADVAVDGDRIVDVGRDVRAGRREVTAGGLALAPGFIDVHTHDDWALLVQPDLGFKTQQGVTTVVTGNCGFGPAPVTDIAFGPSTFERMRDFLERIEEATPAVNVAALAGHGSIRAAVMGTKTARQADRGERVRMAELLDAALVDGVIGMSTGLAYEPGRYADADEIAELAELVAAVNGVYTTHMRDESDGLLASIDEAITVGEVTGVKVQISHLKANGRQNWSRARAALDRIEHAQQRGIDVMADQYPYTRGSTLLEQVLSSGAFDGVSPFGSLGGDQVLIAAAPKRPEWEGRTLAELAREHGLADKAMAETIVAALGRTCFVVLDTMDEDDVRLIMRHPSVIIGSDGIAAGDKPHPRLAHTFPRVLGTYARDLGVLDMADAVHRMTGASARRFGLVDRGEIRVGAFADLVLFDPATIVDTGTYADPLTPPVGIVEVWVNGVTVVHDGAGSGTRPGRVLRRS
jgi:N-acyl-D-amino-acid deacylase